jgi:hypothetical protein
MTRPRSMRVEAKQSAAPARLAAGASPTRSTPPVGAIPERGAGRSPPEPDSATNFDRLLRARVGRLSLGLSPPGLLLVYLD